MWFADEGVAARYGLLLPMSYLVFFWLEPRFIGLGRGPVGFVGHSCRELTRLPMPFFLFQILFLSNFLKVCRSWDVIHIPTAL